MCRMFAAISKHAVSGNDLYRFMELAGKKNKYNDETHENGWGIAGYLGNWTVHFGRSASNVRLDTKQYVSAVERAIKSKSRIVLAHIRDASVGDISINNTHPFIYDEWIFCHNGTIRTPEELRVDGVLYEGTTDSEKFFRLLLSGLIWKGINSFKYSIENCIQYIKDKTSYTSLTFLLTNGDYLIAYRDFTEQEGFYTLHYKQEDGSILFSSEPTDNGAWQEVKNGQLMIVDKFGEIVHDSFVQAFPR